MARYILKRILFMLLTLFGIAAITFAITRIAPGDPATLKLQESMTSPKSQPITQRMIEENRKLYGFDKPLFFNVQPKGKKHALKKLMADYLAETEPYYEEQKLRQIRFLSALMLEEIFVLLKNPEAPEAKKAPFRPFVVSALGLNEVQAQEPLEKWEEYYRLLKERFDEKFLRNSLSQWLEQGQDFRKKELLFAKAAAIAPIMERVLTRNPKKLPELVEILSSLTEKPWDYTEKMPEPEKNDLFYAISQFWQQEREFFYEYGFLEKLGRVFSDTQFGLWMGKVLFLDFDISYAHKRPVMELIKERLPVTLQLNLISIVLIYLLALYSGIYASTIHNTKKEKALSLFLFVLYSLPSFWIANLLILFLTGGDFLNLFPSQYLHSPDAESYSSFKYFLDWLWHLVLPVFTLTYGGLAYLSRQMKVSMLEALNQDYIRTARAKGLTEKRVVYRHALRNALIPIITLLGGLLPSLLGGSIIVEEIFTINGMGKLSFEAIMNRDYPVINAIAFLSAFLTLAGILISDLLYAVVDPRIKLEKTRL